jgi:para-aminobenzoate synthetase / 4-amino-4-deoxychorismate lyase
MYATQAEGPRNLERHLKRLGLSASHFGFQFSGPELRRLLSIQCGTMRAGVPYRLRAAIERSGEIVVSCSPLASLDRKLVDVLLAPDEGFLPRSSKDEFLLHKGTVREQYDRAWQMAEERGAFDMLFFNERDELTEGGRSNIFVNIDGRWWTPPVTAGLLPGVMRAVILEDPSWMSAERTLTRKDLEGASELIVCNALRGPIKARIRGRGIHQDELLVRGAAR